MNSWRWWGGIAICLLVALLADRINHHSQILSYGSLLAMSVAILLVEAAIEKKSSDY